MIRSLVLAAAALSLSACVSFLPEPDAPGALYRIGPVQATSRLPVDAVLVVRQPDAPRVLGGVEIVARDGGGAIRFVNDVEWADRLPRLLQLALADALSDPEGGAAVLPTAGTRPTHDLTWRIMEFSLSGNDALVRIETTLIDARSRTPIDRNIVETRSRARGSGEAARAAALVAAAQDAVETIAGQATTQLTALPDAI